MARPSLPAAIAPFRGCPAGCLRVACETLLSPSAQKGKMNNGPRQALALNNSPLRFALRITFPLPQSIPTCIDFIFGKSKLEIVLNMNCLSHVCFSFMLLVHASGQDKR